MQGLAIELLAARGFRNLSGVDVELGARFNVIAGDNGQGKTNLLEAIYLAATTRSFRTTRLAELIGHGVAVASVRARVSEGGRVREQSVGLRRGLREARLDGKRPASLGAYAVVTPVVVFHPGSLALSTGAGAERRRLLDRLALFRHPASLSEVESYGRALRARQKVLETRGDRAADLEHWEELVVRHGLAVAEGRARVSGSLCTSTEEAFSQIAGSGPPLRVAYRPGAPLEPEAFRARLVEERVRDRSRRSATTGPHRDDLVLELGGNPARGIASQGQHRAIVLSLQLAEIALIAAMRETQPILLLDDVSSELDRTRTAALMKALRSTQGQVVITTTRPELLEIGAELPEGERREFSVVGGHVRPD